MTGSSVAWARVLFATLVLTTACKKNQVPEGASVPSGPASGHPGAMLSFTSSATDSDDDSVAVRFDWGDGDTSTWSASLVGGTVAADSHSWAVADTFLVRAQARDVKGALSAWSDPHSVSILTPHPPSTPGVYPFYHSMVAGDGLGVYAHMEDPDGDSVAVRIAWGDGDTVDWSEFYSVPRSVQIDHIWRDTGTYLITAQAKDVDGLTSDWSGPCSVYVWQPKWRYKTEHLITSSPAIAADGTVYIGSFDHYLYAVNPNGTFRWRYKTGGAIWSSPAVGADGTVYFGSEDSFLYAVHPDGTLGWRYGLLAPLYWSSPAIAADGTVYVGSCDSLLYAIEPTGTLKWSYHVGICTESSPAVSTDGTIYVGAAAGIGDYLSAVDPNGTLKWRFMTPGYIHSSPAIAADGTVYVGSDDKSLYAIDSSGTLKWQCLTRGLVLSSPVVAADGTVFVGSDDHCLYAINPNGALKWSYETDGSVSSSPALAADGTVYVVSDDQCLYAIGPDGMRKWLVWTGGVKSSPAIAADGTVYVGSQDLYLYAIVGNSPLADSPWPKYRHDNMNTSRVGGQ